MLDYYTILESVRNKSLILEQEFEQVISKFPELFTGKNDASYMEEKIKGNKLMKLANSYDLAKEYEGYTLAKDMLENPFIIVNFYMIHAYNNTSLSNFKMEYGQSSIWIEPGNQECIENAIIKMICDCYWNSIY